MQPTTTLDQYQDQHLSIRRLVKNIIRKVKELVSGYIHQIRNEPDTRKAVRLFFLIRLFFIVVPLLAFTAGLFWISYALHHHTKDINAGERIMITMLGNGYIRYKLNKVKKSVKAIVHGR